MKTCYKCHESKPLSEFYKHEAMDDGHLGKCKECTKRDVRANRLANIEYYRAYDRARAKEPHVKARISGVSKRWRKEHPDRMIAHGRVSYAIRTGKMTKPLRCQVCGLVKRLHGHHHDYSKPMEVVWVCQPCHKVLDRERRKHECATSS